ncbi:cardiolipin synthase (CMP-forming) [Malassezia obtusa]|uniref:Cardiolipin synthase (CMP-forming) n=1 Tax=Malassezia obtusa TaxID=76774 RepID=A0AAF0E362_9BASI|nr:cardiolipin synthase (CMP-forming) [Malassezia obtusa]
MGVVRLAWGPAAAALRARGPAWHGALPPCTWTSVRPAAVAHAPFSSCVRRARPDPPRDAEVNGARDLRNAVTRGTVGPSVERVGKIASGGVRRSEARADAAPAASAASKAPAAPAAPAASTAPAAPAPAVARLAEDLCTVPNVLTLSRIALCPVIGWAVVAPRPLLAVGLLSVAAATDLLDGYIARRWKSYTVFGSVADPAADKLLMATMVVSLSASGQMPLALACVILGRDVYLMLLAFYLRYRSLPKPRTWARYWDPRYPSVQVSPTRISKYNTFLQLVLVAVLTVYPCLPEAYQIHPHVTRTRDALEWLVAATTVWTGLDYALSRRAVRYLHIK